MKKTLFTLFALAGVAVADSPASSITLHGVVFTAPSGNPLHSAFPSNAAAAAADVYLTGLSYYTNNSKGTAYDGIYLANDAGLKFNHSSSVAVNHLYLGSDIKIKAGTKDSVGQLNWSGQSDALKLNIGSAADAWVDINANYGTAINVSNMSGGALYLNTAGALTLGAALNEGVTVYATITDTANERTLLAADFSNWNGNVILQNEDGTAYNAGAYTWKATETGLKITKAVPEPATATLSLLALAGLAARRRRKQ